MFIHTIPRMWTQFLCNKLKVDLFSYFSSNIERGRAFQTLYSQSNIEKDKLFSVYFNKVYITKSFFLCSEWYCAKIHHIHYIIMLGMGDDTYKYVTVMLPMLMIFSFFAITVLVTPHFGRHKIFIGPSLRAYATSSFTVDSRLFMFIVRSLSNVY